MKFKLNGLKQVQSSIRKLDRGSEKAINKGVQQIARSILKSALSRVPENQGLLKSSLGMEQNTDDMSAKVYADILYAAYVEFGTGGFVEVPKGMEDYAMEFFVSGDGITRPQPFLMPSFNENKEKLLPLIEAELVKLLRNG